MKWTEIPEVDPSFYNPNQLYGLDLNTACYQKKHGLKACKLNYYIMQPELVKLIEKIAKEPNFKNLILRCLHNTNFYTLSLIDRKKNQDYEYDQAVYFLNIFKGGEQEAMMPEFTEQEAIAYNLLNIKEDDIL